MGYRFALGKPSAGRGIPVAYPGHTGGIPVAYVTALKAAYGAKKEEKRTGAFAPVLSSSLREWYLLLSV